MRKKATTTDFLILAYRDYLAARFLLNNNYAIQGATLASSTIEKYLKAILVHLDKDFRKIHLDNLESLKLSFTDTEFVTLFNYLDESFLLILSRVYKFRYIDNIEVSDQIGFFTNQVLAELDYSVFQFEKIFINAKTQYSKDFQSRSEQLYENNYLLNKIDKVDFMTRPSFGYGLRIDRTSNDIFELKSTKKVRPLYSGKIMLIELQNSNERDNTK